MKLFQDEAHRRPRGFAAAGMCLALGLGALLCGGLSAGDEPTAFGGGGTSGDTVGSLPMMAGSGSGQQGGFTLGEWHTGPAVPAFALVGDETELLGMIIDAYPTGVDAGFARFDLGTPGRVRYEFYGRNVIILDRAAFHAGTVRGVVVIGSTFEGGVAQLMVGTTVRAQQVLTEGISDMRLKTMDAAGVLDQRLTWHGMNQVPQHRIIAVEAVGNTIEINQRD